MTFITVRADALKQGDTFVFSNPRFNSVIDSVEWTRDGEIKVETGNYTATAFFECDELVQIDPC